MEKNTLLEKMPCPKPLQHKKVDKKIVSQMWKNIEISLEKIVKVSMKCDLLEVKADEMGEDGLTVKLK